MESGSYTGTGSEGVGYAPAPAQGADAGYVIHSSGSYNAGLIREEQDELEKIFSNISLMKFYDKKTEEKKEKADYPLKNLTSNNNNSTIPLDYMLDSKLVKPNSSGFDIKAAYYEKLPSVLKRS